MATSIGPLIQWCSSELSALLGGDASEDFAKYLLEIDNVKDLEDYLQELLDIADPKAQAFIQELLRKKHCSAPPDNMTVYKKPVEDNDYAPKTTKTQAKSKVKEKKPGGFIKVDLSALKSEIRMPGDPPPPATVPPTAAPHQPIAEAQANRQGAKRKQKYVALYSKEGEARSVVHLAGRHWCECQAQKHSLVANCLKCGRVVCHQEGSGPCLFCGTLVCTREEQEILARNSKTSEKLRRKLMGEGKKEEPGAKVANNGDISLPHVAARLQSGLDKALQHKDRLIEYDKTSVRRTKVIDDESDYFSTDSNQWLTKDDRAKLEKRKQELRELKHGSRLKKTFTLDFAGRKVVEDTDQVNMYDGQDEVVQAVNFGKSGQVKGHRGPVGDSDIINPNITQDAPHFVQSKEDRYRLSDPATMHKSEKLSLSSKTGALRIQDRELMEMSDEGYCLSMHQPWASLLVTGVKKHEGRTWYSSHRGRLWIAAASHQATAEEIAQVENAHLATHQADDAEEEIFFPREYPTSCLLGCVDMVDCLSQDQYQEQYPRGDSSSPYVFICENPQELVVRFPIKGKHKIWKMDGQILKAAKKGLRKPKDH
ncbi:activating signal cointegrator 1-like [Patiria miniata]|uniref:ASCH domain-containing protein n=1 Tax=Patiria miniata TaxID=46514 RepID=A0A914BMA7_PATMI|nr:activating signal cointegrator 1-like [Patiria miniata]